MKLEAAKRLSAANWKTSLSEVTNPKIVSAVNALSSHVSISSVNTDGYEGGCEVTFKGKDSNLVEYASTAMNSTTMLAVSKIMTTLAGEKIDVALLPSEDGEFVLLIPGE